MRFKTEDVSLSIGKLDPQKPADFNKSLAKLVNKLNDVLRKIARTGNVNEASAVYTPGTALSALPTPSAALVGRFYHLAQPHGAGVNDALYLCRKTNTDSYAWVLIV